MDSDLYLQVPEPPTEPPTVTASLPHAHILHSLSAPICACAASLPPPPIFICDALPKRLPHPTAEWMRGRNAFCPSPHDLRIRSTAD